MTIVITGASRGIGAALAAQYKAAGEEVIGTARGAGVEAVLDVTDPASHAAFATTLKDRPLDLLICNAGVYLDKGDDMETGFGADLWTQSFAVNVTGVFLTVQSLLPNLRAASGAKIAIIASQMGSSTRAPGGSYIYRASKAAAINLGRNLAVDLKPEGIAVGIYHPGWVRTDMGGDQGEISVTEAAQGLAQRIEALDLVQTGAFETWDGRAHPF
ncbi:C-factor [Sulfitobacter indolifex]|uniref:Oxidoreductase, short-chain dehydrogenase/reductase family protein n=1 Tax=Sulfitobacter indolifex HEL-45 TaxID=391624 RepID=A0ABM9X687_9RHOB|nr:SDR family NAD(P)-dependent oxidoreductase [Sulfitobacter indolifex]EDQ05035.1 oxidoreductase, short-chain dehydrogenase/reductase family protein [Sulfitobacter indolifex HEL-45]UOA18084.1 C-factor [Sulfitobacter indolifex]